MLFVVSRIPPKTTNNRKSPNRLQTVGFDVPSVLCDCWSMIITLEGSVTLQNCLEGYFGDVIVSKIWVKIPKIRNAPKSFQTSLNYAAIVSTFRLIYRGHYRRYLNPDGVARLQITAEQYQKSSINPQNILHRISDTIQTWISAGKCDQNNTDKLVEDCECTRIVVGTLGAANASSRNFHFLWSHFEADYWYYPESRFHFISSIGVIKSRISLVYDSN